MACVDPAQLRAALEELYALQAQHQQEQEQADALRPSNPWAQHPREDQGSLAGEELEDWCPEELRQGGSPCPWDQDRSGAWGGMASPGCSRCGGGMPEAEECQGQREMGTCLGPEGGDPRLSPWASFRGWADLESSCAELDASGAGAIVGMDLTFLVQDSDGEGRERQQEGGMMVCIDTRSPAIPSRAPWTSTALASSALCSASR